MMSPHPTQESQESAPNSFQADEETWFSSKNQKKRALKTSPTTPPPPIGDALADTWFR